MSDNFSLRFITSLALILFWVTLFFLPLYLLSASIVTLAVCTLFLEWFSLCEKNHYLLFLTPLYPILPFLFLIHLTMEPKGVVQFFVLVVLVSAFDTGSYLIGSLYGKRFMIKSISPRKTWEGFLGGMIVLFGIGFLLMWFISINIPQRAGYLFDLFFIGIFAFLGDLFESFIKRTASVKDSGIIFPGHGGFLDRFDSLLGAICYLYIFQRNLIP